MRSLRVRGLVRRIDRRYHRDDESRRRARCLSSGHMGGRTPYYVDDAGRVVARSCLICHEVWTPETGWVSVLKTAP